MKNFKRLALLFAFLLVVGVLAACGGSSEEEGSGSEDGGSGDSITVGGSSAMQPLVAAAAEEYMAENSDAQIDVQGGGSGTGLSEVAAGNFDIGNSDYFAETKDDIDAEELVDHKVAVVGMTAAAHPEVGVDNLSKDELKDIFTGEITNWSEVGGADEEITLVNRPDGSGTRATFNEFGLDGEEPAEGITEDSSNRVMQIVNDTPGAVGYLSFAYFERNEDIVPMGIDGVEPTDENVQSGEFPIWAYQHSYTQGEPEGLEKDFLDYMMSEEVQTTILPDQGYIPATEMEVERDAEGNESEIE
ncbi:phosphate-binding protein PstS [Halobacillus andaensis]|uniref:Phosphate-binding protein n=1 Tax=Halobacillus andaensis TaxID=1176239 RepID=A0A917AYL3_HALAA|nr:phosphate ABC transporter substrate-binding protein [Halobacillus andaensis]MBP2003082.1 phosphate transport system substrate-binding protein [Halobacillus andaensis]GGF07856.1 phosphate-binding protein PstS [Halobacillus andaensis]